MTNLKNFCDNLFPDILNVVNLLTLAPSPNISTNSDILSNENPNLSSFNKINESYIELFSERKVQLNSGTIRKNRYERKFVSANVINLSNRHLSKDKVSVLSKGLKFVPALKHIKKLK